MSAPPKKFSRNAVLTAGLLVVLAITFGMYVRSEEAVDAAATTRLNSRLLADEMRNSSDELTRMARSYAITGDTVYRKQYQAILDIRDGKLPRPQTYTGSWHLHRASPAQKAVERQKPAALLDLMRGAGFTNQELAKLAQAKSISDSLTGVELRAMEMTAAEARGGPRSRERVIGMLYDDAYHDAKGAIMAAIDAFLTAVDRRTLAAVERAHSTASLMRLLFIAVAIVMSLMLWRTYAALRTTMGGSVAEVHRRIAALGGGSVVPTDEEKRSPNSVLGWLSEANARLTETNRERTLSEERMRAVVESALDCIISMTADGKITEFNPAAERTFGYKREEALGRTLADLIVPPALRAAHEEGLRRFLATRTARILGKRVELPALRADGTEILVELAVTRLGSQEPPVFTGFMRDISEHKRDLVRLSEQAALLDHAQDAIIVRDLENKVTYWNQGAERLYGWTAVEAKGRSVVGLFFRDPAPFLAASAKVMNEGHWAGELENLTRDGSRRTVASRWTLVRDVNGAPQSIMLIDTDISGHKTLEQQFLRAQRMESIGTLAGGIAHDLNNVLAPIMMSIGLLKETVTSPEDQELLETIAGSARRGADMVAQVLSFARGVDGQRSPVRAKHLVGEIQKIVSDTFPKNIAIRTLVKPDLWTIIGDQTQLHQVLINLCVNARDAMPNGGQISITAENCAVDAAELTFSDGAVAGTYVRIKVEDTGHGIAAADLEKIFDPFFTTKEIGKGTGLGLSTSLGILRSHGGFVRVNSEVGKGTRFGVYLPATTDARSEEQSKPALQQPRGNGETVLIVDDEPAIRHITGQTLESFGYRVLLAADGTEAIAIYAQQQQDIAVVLTDMMMPVLDGLSTIQVLMRMNPNVRIIAVSGITANRSVATDAGTAVRQYLGKPFTAETLLATVQQVLSER
jgi:two-component system, cell cycle sensor histidine kinase and response regulator CckA